MDVGSKVEVVMKSSISGFGLLLCCLIGAQVLPAQHSPYAGLESRSIKALSEAQIEEGYVQDAWSSGMMFRGIELIMP